MSSLLSQQAPINIRGAADIALLHRMECRACPLDKMPDGKLEPTGSSHPLVYVLGEAAGATEAEEREQFVGESGQLLRAYVPRKHKDQLRFNNCARSHPPKNATPDKTILECCRPSVQRDIEAAQPKVIFGFGNIPLEWVSGFSGIMLWRGRKMPVKVGNHVCWFYPMLHPAYLVRQRRGSGIPSEEERMFGFDMKRAFAEVESLPVPVVHSPSDVRRGVEIITGEGGDKDLDRLEDALFWASEQDVIGLDYETSCLRPYMKGAKILSAAVGNAARAVAFALDHPEAGWTPEQCTEAKALWAQFLKRAKGIKAVHNLSFEMEWTAVFFGEKLLRAGVWGDTSTQAAIIDERKGNKKAGPFSLEFLIQQYFGFNLKKLAGVDRQRLEETPIEAVLQYNAPDARYHALLFEKQKEVIVQEGLTEPYDLGVRAVPAAVLMQVRGLPVDQKEVVRLKSKYDKTFESLLAAVKKTQVVKEFERRKGQPFKPLSNPDVIFILKDILHRKEILVVDKYTKKPRYSADEGILEQIDHPFAELLVDLRKANKKRSTYVYPLDVNDPETLVYPDGLLHAQFNTVFAATGRFSCDGPNLQNFPKRDNEAKELRKQIVAPPGHLMLAFDMGQIEARVIAMFTRDKRFCKALWERYDVHQEWAERLARSYPSRVGGSKSLSDKKAMKAFRTDVKNQWTFPLFFGARLESAAGYLDIPVDVIKPHYEEFWRQFSGVKEWQESQLEFYKDKGYVECLTGKRRYGPLSTNQIFNCVDSATEALSENGWVTVDELRAGVKLWTKNPETGRPELQEILALHRSRYQGPVRVMGGALNSVTTPNHRWLVDVRWWKRGQCALVPTFIESSALAEHRGSDHRVHTSADKPVLQDKTVWTDDEVRLIGWVLTDGCYRKYTAKRPRKNAGALISIVQSMRANPEKVDIIDGIFKRLGISYKRYDYYRTKRCSTSVSWAFSFDLAKRIRAALPNKTLTPKFLYSLSTEQLHLLYENMLLGDGSFDFEANRYRSMTVGTKERADAFSLLCSLIGVPHRIKLFIPTGQPTKKYVSMGNILRANPCWTVKIGKRRRAHPGFNSKWESFDGDVWCPTVKNGTFFARREGRVYITGNSPVQGTAAAIVIEALCRLSEIEDPELQPEIQIHDDLTWARVPEKRVDEIAGKILDIMLKPVFPWINVPLTVEGSIGPNWLEMEEFGVFSSDDWLGMPKK